MKREALITQLQTTPLFQGISSEAILALITSPKTVTQSFKAGDFIYSPESTEKQLGVFLSGNATAHSVDSQNGVLLRSFAKNDMFGLATLFGSRNRYVSIITAKNSCRVMFFSAEDIRVLLDDPTFSMNYIRCLSDKICYLNTKISCFTAGSPERKLAFFLCLQSPAKSFSLNINANALSEMLNVGRASLYRVFDKFTADGFIKKEGKTITLIDRNAMMEFYK
ncbi:MAG: Crp/Fnr family transcriptional regulator [Clostridia bacterium]|nr:Crp/Fnr family transcriptional regulator [Clostridia bacterium]